MTASNQGGNKGGNGNNTADQDSKGTRAQTAGSHQQSHAGGNTQSGGKGASSQSDSARGFASMDPKQQREIAAEGGRAAHASGNAHEFTSQEAREAGAMSHKNDGNKQSDSDSGSQSKSGGSKQSDSGTGSQSKSGGSKQSDSDTGSHAKSGGSHSGSASSASGKSESGSRSK